MKEKDENDNGDRPGAPFGVSQGIHWRPYFFPYHIGLPQFFEAPMSSSGPMVFGLGAEFCGPLTCICIY